MPLYILTTADNIEVLENFVEEHRPPPHLRKTVDLCYKIENQSIIIYELRHHFDDPEKYIESPIAKTTFVKAKDQWKVFWMRADLKWHSYKPKPVLKTLRQFTAVVDADEYGCFWG